jgi:SAM-dependent methyltransferase
MAEVAKAEKTLPAKPDYGLDAPLIVRRMFNRGGWTLAVGIALYLINRSQYPGPATHLLLVIGGIGAVFLAIGGMMLWSSRVGKLQLRDRLVDSLHLTGGEKVLDVGCGRGLLVIGAAKRLKTGKATGVDIWDPKDLSGNTPEAAKQNAKIEGVADRVRIENCDARKLHYPDNSYDVVLSSTVIHNIPDPDERSTAVREMWRVLKPGGQLLIFDIRHVPDYAQDLRDAGAPDVTVAPAGFLWCFPTKSLLAKK